jgi:Flp pilus assembly protein TadG
MRSLSISERSSALVRRFCKDRRGVSAIEFAMIAPLMITIYLGGVEVTQAVAVDRKTTIVAHTVADLVAQDINVSDSDMNDILSASASVASPYAAANLQVTVSSIMIDSSGKATISWSDTLNGTAHTVNGPVHKRGDKVTLPTALAVPSTSLIWGEVSYAYKPMFGVVLTGTFNLGDAIYMRPRLTSCITRGTATTC